MPAALTICRVSSSTRLARGIQMSDALLMEPQNLEVVSSACKQYEAAKEPKSRTIYDLHGLVPVKVDGAEEDYRALSRVSLYSTHQVQRLCPKRKTQTVRSGPITLLVSSK